jgi:hypothetical protein
MPLYTYVVSYRGATYAEQTRASNFKGFAGGVVGSIPASALPTLPATLRNEMLQSAMRCEWREVPNRSGLWRAAFDLAGDAFVIYAVLSKD